MVDEFNRLMDEQRYAEAEVVAKRAEQLDPENPVIVQLINQVTFVRRFMSNESLRDAKEIGFWEQMNSVDESSVGFDDNNPIQFGNLQDWEELTKRRSKMFDRNRNRSERELEIEQKLKTPVSLQFDNAPLSKVLDHLAKLAEVNLLPRSARAGRGRRHHRHAGDDRPAQRNHAQERVEPDPRAAAPELRDQGRSAEDHQRADARRRGLSR